MYLWEIDFRKIFHGGFYRLIVSDTKWNMHKWTNLLWISKDNIDFGKLSHMQLWLWWWWWSTLIELNMSKCQHITWPKKDLYDVYVSFFSRLCGQLAFFKFYLHNALNNNWSRRLSSLAGLTLATIPLRLNLLVIVIGVNFPWHDSWLWSRTRMIQ